MFLSFLQFCEKKPFWFIDPFFLGHKLSQGCLSRLKFNTLKRAHAQTGDAPQSLVSSEPVNSVVERAKTVVQETQASSDTVSL